MKRAILALTSTVAALVFILSHKTTPLASTAASGTATSASASASARAVEGAAAQTEHGPITVTLTLDGDTIVQATAVQESTSPRSQEISSRAIPQLNEEVLTAQSADVDTISGATDTSEGYRESLQSALDKA